MAKSLVLAGFMKSINQYNQITLIPDEATLTSLKLLTKDFEGNSPLGSWTGEDGTVRYSLKVALQPKDKNVHKNFTAIAAKTGKQVKMQVSITQYDFKKGEEHIHGWKATMISVSA